LFGELLHQAVYDLSGLRELLGGRIEALIPNRLRKVSNITYPQEM
jgi:hypothetical protein